MIETPNYIARVWDILVHTRTMRSQRVYRVASIQLGGRNQEGVVELEPLNFSKPDVDDLGEINVYVPHMLLDHAVECGLLACVWRHGYEKIG